jgi:hypothetical protein
MGKFFCTKCMMWAHIEEDEDNELLDRCWHCKMLVIRTQMIGPDGKERIEDETT